MNWRGRKVFVTGAGGFIGSHLAERLVKEGAKVKALVHYNALGSRGWLDASPLSGDMEIVAGDVRDGEYMEEAAKDAEVIFHLAALIAIPYSYKSPSSYVKTNIEGTLNLLNAARKAGVHRFVQTSTSEVYGTAREVPITEAHPLQGQSPYSASKIGSDKMAESYHLSFDLPLVTVRPFNTFGPRQSARAVIPTIITQCLNGGEIKLGNLTPTRDMNFVSNTVEGFLAAGCAPDTALGKTVNLGSGREISIGHLAALIAETVGVETNLSEEKERLRPPNSEVERLLASNALAKELLGWEPAVDLETGLKLTVEWFRENMDRYRPGVYAV